ncbi:MAG: hypothetical protein IIA82_05705 [Thaumarchaeota archaeon]|nr:hypothetical protein [Nitrososphaerota archaeon]
MLDENDLLNRIIQVKNLKENCFKYLEESSSKLLTHKIIFSIAKLSSEKMDPVKLAAISEDIFGNSDKSKQDLIRLTMEKSLSKCGIVEKNYGKIKEFVLSVDVIENKMIQNNHVSFLGE